MARDLVRLVEGLSEGDPTAVAVLIFALVGTAVIVAVTSLVRRRRSRSGPG